MASNTVKFDSIINFLRSRSSAAIKAEMEKFEGELPKMVALPAEE